jgi:hypothetical protein
MRPQHLLRQAMIHEPTGSRARLTRGDIITAWRRSAARRPAPRTTRKQGQPPPAKPPAALLLVVNHPGQPTVVFRNARTTSRTTPAKSGGGRAEEGGEATHTAARGTRGSGHRAGGDRDLGELRLPHLDRLPRASGGGWAEPPVFSAGPHEVAGPSEVPLAFLLSRPITATSAPSTRGSCAILGDALAETLHLGATAGMLVTFQRIVGRDGQGPGPIRRSSANPPNPHALRAMTSVMQGPLRVAAAVSSIDNRRVLSIPS